MRRTVFGNQFNIVCKDIDTANRCARHTSSMNGTRRSCDRVCSVRDCVADKWAQQRTMATATLLFANGGAGLCVWARTAGCNSRHRIEMLDRDQWSRSKTPGSPAPHRWRGSASELESRWGGCHRGRAWPLTAWPPRSRPSASRTHWHLQTPIPFVARLEAMSRAHAKNPASRQRNLAHTAKLSKHRACADRSVLLGQVLLGDLSASPAQPPLQGTSRQPAKFENHTAAVCRCKHKNSNSIRRLKKG
jgi:hypothetical protein